MGFPALALDLQGHLGQHHKAVIRLQLAGPHARFHGQESIAEANRCQIGQQCAPVGWTMATQGDGALPLHQLQIFESTDVVANQIRAWGPGW